MRRIETSDDRVPVYVITGCVNLIRADALPFPTHIKPVVDGSVVPHVLIPGRIQPCGILDFPVRRRILRRGDIIVFPVDTRIILNAFNLACEILRSRNTFDNERLRADLSTCKVKNIPFMRWVFCAQFSKAHPAPAILIRKNFHRGRIHSIVDGTILDPKIAFHLRKLNRQQKFISVNLMDAPGFCPARYIMRDKDNIAHGTSNGVHVCLKTDGTHEVLIAVDLIHSLAVCLRV